MHDVAVIRRPPEIHGAAFDLMVVGGTLFACALAREAAVAGLRTLLVAPDDPGAGGRARTWLCEALAPVGASSAATALAERERLLREAPHRVRPIRSVVVDAFPAGTAESARRRLRRLAGAMPQSTLPAAQELAAAAALQVWPGLSTAAAAVAVLAFDAELDEAGLSRCLVRGAIDAGATCWTHAAVAHAGIDGIEVHAPWCGRRAVVRAPVIVATEAFESVAGAFFVDVGARLIRGVAVGCAVASAQEELARLAVGAMGVLEVAPGRAPSTGWWRSPACDEPRASCLRDLPELGLDERALFVGGEVAITAQRAEESTVAGTLVLEAPSPLRALSAARLLRERLFPGSRHATAAPIPGGTGPRLPLEPLWRRHGSAASIVARRAAASAAARTALCPHDGVLAAEVDVALADDGAICFADVVRRLFAAGACRDPQCLLRAHACYLRSAGDVPDADAAAAVAAAIAAPSRATVTGR